jgi:hypothetical protein
MSWERMGISKTRGMGFRDLEVFNKALLSKQLWRLFQSPDSMVARILKAKYYPSSSILEAKLGNRPSYVWQSLMAAQPTLQNRLFWRIGYGKNIYVWRDKWLLKLTTYKVQSPGRILDSSAQVSELIDQDKEMK